MLGLQAGGFLASFPGFLDSTLRALQTMIVFRSAESSRSASWRFYDGILSQISCLERVECFHRAFVDDAFVEGPDCGWDAECECFVPEDWHSFFVEELACLHACMF